MAKKKIVGRVTARIDLPPSFLEGVFGSFSVFRADGEDQCVRYAIGTEELRCFVPVFDHRPAVLAAAKVFDKDPGPEAALQLVSSLSKPADVEVGRRTGKAGQHPFLSLFPARSAEPRYSLEGSEQEFDPAALRAGIAHDGRDAAWYWLGVLPSPAGAETGLKLVHLCLSEYRV